MMNLFQRPILALSIALLFCNAALANDPPKPADAAAEKAAADKAAADKAAESALPSKPYPKNAAPFKPKGNPESAVAAITADKHDNGHDKSDKSDKHDKPADKAAAAEPHHAAPAKKHKPAAHAANSHGHAAADPALRGVLNDTVKADAHGQSPEREPYVVQARDTMDRVIKKTFPTTPFSIEVMREAFMKANPQALAAGKSARLRPGSVLRLPDAGIIRLVVLGEMAPPMMTAAANSGGSGNGNGNAHSVGLSQSGSHDAPKIIAVPAPPAAAPTAPAAMIEPPAPPIALPRQAVTVASSANPAPEVTSEEKKKWVRFP
jgi:hypothetical protein